MKHSESFLRKSQQRARTHATNIEQLIKKLRESNLYAVCPCGGEFKLSKAILFDGTKTFPKEALEIMDKSSVKRPPVDWALQFLWNKPEVSVVLSGMSSYQQVKENCDSAEKSGINSLTPNEVKIVDELASFFIKNTFFLYFKIEYICCKC